MADTNKVKSTKKVFMILELIAKNDGHMKLSSIAETLNFPVSTTHRFLDSLREIGYVNQDEDTGEYILGVKLLTLANAVLSKMDLRKAAYPFLEYLRDTTGESANLVVMDSEDALYLDKVDSKARIRAYTYIGSRAPLHATGVGKVMLADMAWPDVVEIMEKKGMEKVTTFTITNLDDLMEELYKVRKQGYAVDAEECELGARCIAAPVRNHTGKVIASISISGPKSRFSEERIEETIPILLKSADELSETMGYSSKPLRQSLGI